MAGAHQVGGSAAARGRSLSPPVVEEICPIAWGCVPQPWGSVTQLTISSRKVWSRSVEAGISAGPATRPWRQPARRLPGHPGGSLVCRCPADEEATLASTPGCPAGDLTPVSRLAQDQAPPPASARVGLRAYTGNNSTRVGHQDTLRLTWLHEVETWILLSHWTTQTANRWH